MKDSIYDYFWVSSVLTGTYFLSTCLVSLLKERALGLSMPWRLYATCNVCTGAVGTVHAV